MAFRVGQKVVCVDGTDRDNDASTCRGSYWMPNYPDEGSVYTIRDIRGNGGLFLVEVVNPQRTWAAGDTAEGCWCPTRFRPVQTTDISIFTAMLNPSRETVSG